MSLDQPTTIRDVAAAVGVSPSTVSRVLSGSVPVTEKRRAAVVAAIERLHFHPSLTAQRLVRGRSWEIGVLAQGIASPFYASMLAGIAGALRDTGYQPIFAEGWAAELVVRALDTFVRRHVDALIVVGGQTLDDLLLQLATRHLLALGHTRIAHVTGSPSHWDSAERLQGYRQTLAQAGLRGDPRLVLAGDFDEPSGYQAVSSLLRRRVRFSAVFAGNDQMAYGAMLALHHRGLRVPQDVSVVGFDGQRGARFTTPPLTTVRQPAGAMGRAAAEGVLRALRGEPLALPVFSPELMVRESTAPCRRAAAGSDSAGCRGRAPGRRRGSRPRAGR